MKIYILDINLSLNTDQTNIGIQKSEKSEIDKLNYDNI